MHPVSERQSEPWGADYSMVLGEKIHPPCCTPKSSRDDGTLALPIRLGNELTLMASTNRHKGKSSQQSRDLISHGGRSAEVQDSGPL